MFIKYFKIISSFFSKLFGEKRFVYSVKSLSFKHKINKSNTKISTNYWIVCLYSKKVSFNVFIVNKHFNFFWNMFHTKRIEINDIVICTYKATHWVPISNDSSRFIIYSPSFIFNKLSREKTPLNIDSFWYFWVSKLVKGWGGIKDPFCFHNQLLQSLH